MNNVEKIIKDISNQSEILYHADKTSKEQKLIIREMYSNINKLKSSLEREFEAIESFERDLY